MASARDTHFDFGLDLPPVADVDPLRGRIARAYRADEAATVRALIGEARLAPDELAATQALATRLAEAVRAERVRASGVDALMVEFSLETEEGVALMCLAEALLRIPDDETRDRLIRDKVSQGSWAAHVGASPSLFVNAAAWGLLVTGKLVDMRNESALQRAVSSLLRKGGEPLIRLAVDLAMRLLGRQFVTGRTIEEALANSREREARGYTFSYDMLGEAALTAEDALRYYGAYETAIHAIGRAADRRGAVAGPGISVKLSALHPRYARSQRERVRAELTPLVFELARLARSYGIGLSLDAEEADRLELSLDLFAALAADPGLAGWDGLGFVVQAYQKRARHVVDWLIALAREHRRRIPVRLVKGAYWDGEVKRAQVDGLASYPVFTRKVHTDVAYLACAKALLAASEIVYPQLASHNAFTIAAIDTLAGDIEFEYQCLHGMGESIYDEVVGAGKLGRRCRVYAPVGSHETLLPYLVRRLLENGANTSFVNRIADPDVPIASLVADPVAGAERTRGTPHPHIPLPPALFSDRRNSQGLDLSDDSSLAAFAQALAAVPLHETAAPLIGGDEGSPDRARATVTIRNPADRDDVVGAVVEAAADDVARALAVAADQGRMWSRETPDARAQCLERAADLIESERVRFAALAMREAGKTLVNGIAEVREAADFCRYYAVELRKLAAGGSAGEPIGPVVSISPWNFPLSIFVGQLAAALAAGNSVVAKSAEQTPLIAAAAVRLFHRAGVPRAALQWLPGRGETIGAALVRDPRIAGVLFTGSTEVARDIHRELSRRDDDPVLIAETGGQNAMIVDSSALPEQVVNDALASAFDSAGQRCSALRVLCLQEDVAEHLLRMLEGALAQLSIGDPRRLATDVGPVIDASARDALLAHIEAQRAAGRRVVQPPLPPECARGTFVAPTIVELGGIEGLSALTREVFGPVLHVVRWARDELPALVEAINASGYGLTHGIHTRIDETVATILERVRAGNVYVNRNIIGAVVGVQPFGGHGLSGTGPKAGGPLYLPRLMRGGVAPVSVARHVEESMPAQAPARVLSRVVLPGPTGESNELEIHPRGVVACIADDERALVTQAQAALASGNTPLMLRSHLLLNARDAFEDSQILLADRLDPDAVDVVLLDTTPERARRVRAEIAASEGRIVPIVVPDAAGRYDAALLVVERSVTVNTAATGGNAALLSLPEDEAGARVA